MSVRVEQNRRTKTGGWEVDIRLRLPDDREVRYRRRLDFSTEAKARRWAELKRREMENEILRGRTPCAAPVPTLAEFAPSFMNRYARANRHKPSGIDSKQRIIEYHLLPAFGSRRLDTICNHDVAVLLARLQHRRPKTVNNVLSVLKRMLQVAVDWGMLERLPCHIKLLRVPREERAYYTFEQYDRLLNEVRASGTLAYIIVLLGAEAGLRCGEMLALQWDDVRWDVGKLVVSKACWRGHVTATKGGKPRTVKLTPRLLEALGPGRGSSGTVLATAEGTPLTINGVRSRLRGAMKRAGVRHGVHTLRHSFCSHMAMLGVPTLTIQRLAGHQSITTTERYMHLSDNCLDDAIEMLGSRT